MWIVSSSSASSGVGDNGDRIRYLKIDVRKLTCQLQIQIIDMGQVNKSYRKTGQRLP